MAKMVPKIIKRAGTLKIARRYNLTLWATVLEKCQIVAADYLNRHLRVVPYNKRMGVFTCKVTSFAKHVTSNRSFWWSNPQTLT